MLTSKERGGKGVGGDVQRLVKEEGGKRDTAGG